MVGPTGKMPAGQIIDQFVTMDVLVHTSDLARTIGADERLDEDSVRRNWTGASVSKQLTVDCHLGTVGVEGQHPFHFGGLCRRPLVAPYDAVMDLSVDVERPI
jgi:hypothetical protein